MTSFWKTMADVTREKLTELGTVGVVLGVVWLVGIWVLFDWMQGAMQEAVPQAAAMLGGMLAVWVLVGLGVYLWFDPHRVRDRT